MSQETISNLAKCGYDQKQIDAAKRFLRGEKPMTSMNIEERKVYGYGHLDSNGFWEFQIPAIWDDIVSERLKTECLADLIIDLKDRSDYWNKTKIMDDGSEKDVCRVYQVRWKRGKQEDDLLELPKGWRRYFSPGKRLYVIDHDPRHIIVIKTLKNALDDLGLMPAQDIIKVQEKWPARFRNGMVFSGAVRHGGVGQLNLIIMANTFTLTGKQNTHRDKKTFQNKRNRNRNRKFRSEKTQKQH
jgi:hypothetical protein